MEKQATQPIGVFDSGVGGITVVTQLKKLLPGEDIVYLGDTSRMPYGEKSEEELKAYTREDINFLSTQNVKLILCACNAASAVGLPGENWSLPVIGMLNDQLADSFSKHDFKKVLVVGTRATVRSHAYKALIEKASPQTEVTELACPLLASIVEEGLAHSEIARETVEYYASSLKDEGFEAVVLGCTHYPLLTEHFAALFPNALLINPATFAASSAQKYLSTHQLLNNKNQSNLSCFVTDEPAKFDTTSALFFANDNVEYPQCSAKVITL